MTVNGRPLGIVWRAPFHVDVTVALKPGPNALEVKVTNLRVNRPIGGQQADAARKCRFTAGRFDRANSPLLLSGLLGPVQFGRSEQRAPALGFICVGKPLGSGRSGRNSAAGFDRRERVAGRRPKPTSRNEPRDLDENAAYSNHGGGSLVNGRSRRNRDRLAGTAFSSRHG